LLHSRVDVRFGQRLTGHVDQTNMASHDGCASCAAVVFMWAATKLAPSVSNSQHGCDGFPTPIHYADDRDQPHNDLGEIICSTTSTDRLPLISHASVSPDPVTQHVSLYAAAPGG